MTKMKKLLSVGLAALLAVSFAACSNSNSGGEEGGNSAETAKTGYAVISEIQDVEDTKLTIDSVCAAVLVGENGKIIDCKIDEAQTKPDLETNSGTVDDLRTKLEKKEDYAMKAISPIGKEWYEQVAAFEAWAVGKTADEISAGVGADGVATDADLSAGCTINVAAIAKAVSDAARNAQSIGASATDKLSLKVATEKYYESTDENLQYDSNYAIVTLDANGKITSCIIDASQAKCTIADGKFTVAAGSFQSKKELKDAYSMKAISPIGKEWYEQAAAFEAWAVGKTASEITAGADATGTPTDADLVSGCTINVASIVSTVAAAATVA